MGRNKFTSFIAVYEPESNKRRKLSLKRRKKGPPKELFPAEGRLTQQTTPNEVEEVSFDLGFDVEEDLRDGYAGTV